MSDKGYNGWTNYETWATALWIGNDPGSEETARELTREAKGDAADLARSLREWVDSEPDEGGMIPDLGSSLAADLLRAALSEVDWYEIAESYIADAADEAEDEE